MLGTYTGASLLANTATTAVTTFGLIPLVGATITGNTNAPTSLFPLELEESALTKQGDASSLIVGWVNWLLGSQATAEPKEQPWVSIAEYEAKLDKYSKQLISDLGGDLAEGTINEAAYFASLNGYIENANALLAKDLNAASHVYDSLKWLKVIANRYSEKSAARLEKFIVELTDRYPDVANQRTSVVMPDVLLSTQQAQLEQNNDGIASNEKSVRRTRGVIYRQPRGELIYDEAATAVYETPFEVSDLNGTNGFQINGAEAGFEFKGLEIGEQCCNSVSGAGDVNGDGYTDLVVVGGEHSPSAAGYVVFGQENFSEILELSGLDGSNGFQINRIEAYDYPSSVSSAGDVNKDGYDDIIIGSARASPGGRAEAGESYVVFGRANFNETLELSELDGSNGFQINGIKAGDNSGWSVSSAGDVNKDGFDDVVIGAPSASARSSYSTPKAGESYVVFGRANFNETLELSELDGSNGFQINGVSAEDNSGQSVSDAGDVNKDGYADIIIGAPGIRPAAGQGYVIFGQANFNKLLELSKLNGSNGFQIDGIAGYDRTGFSVSGAGDVNGDSFDDVVIGAYEASPGGLHLAGRSYVVFGQANFSKLLKLSELSGNDGFQINGALPGDCSGFSVSDAGDVNKDGYADIIIGAPQPNYRDDKDIGDVGQSYLVFGQANFSKLLELSELNGMNGFQINDIAVEGDTGISGFGVSVSGVGDLNKDGYADLIIGAPNASPQNITGGNRRYLTGKAAVILGGRTTSTPSPTPSPPLNSLLLGSISVVAGLGVLIFCMSYYYRQYKQSKGYLLPDVSDGECSPLIDDIRDRDPTLSKWILESEDLQCDNKTLLGKGRFGKVYLGKWKRIGVAVKKLERDEQTQAVEENFLAEVKVMSELTHDHVIPLYGIVVNPHEYCIVMMLMHRSLYSLLHSKEELSWLLRCQIGLDIAKGLEYLHSRSFLHRDLKSVNVLLDQSNKARLADFGLVQIKSSLEQTHSSDNILVGSLPWTAPEILNNTGSRFEYTKASDVYSFAMVLWELSSRESPYKDQMKSFRTPNFRQWLGMHLAKGKEKGRLTIPAGTPDILRQLIVRGWDDVKTRIDLKEMLDLLEAFLLTDTTQRPSSDALADQLPESPLSSLVQGGMFASFCTELKSMASMTNGESSSSCSYDYDCGMGSENSFRPSSPVDPVSSATQLDGAPDQASSSSVYESNGGGSSSLDYGYH